MVRGKPAKEGDTKWSPNGYHYTFKDGKFVLTHRMLMEQHLNRPLKDDEYVKFKDNDRTNIKFSNIELRVYKAHSKARKLAQLKARREQLDLEIRELESLES